MPGSPTYLHPHEATLNAERVPAIKAPRPRTSDTSFRRRLCKGFGYSLTLLDPRTSFLWKFCACDRGVGAVYLVRRLKSFCSRILLASASGISGMCEVCQPRVVARPQERRVLSVLHGEAFCGIKPSLVQGYLGVSSLGVGRVQTLDLSRRSLGFGVSCARGAVLPNLTRKATLCGGCWVSRRRSQGSCTLYLK